MIQTINAIIPKSLRTYEVDMKTNDSPFSSVASRFLLRAVCAGCISVASVVLFSGCDSVPLRGTTDSQQPSKGSGSIASSQGLIRMNIGGLPSVPKSTLMHWPEFEEACESRLKAAVRVMPTRSYVASEQVDALVDSLRERIRLRHLTLDEYSLWGEQTRRLPDYERVEWMEISIRSWKNLGWKIDDSDYQRRFLAENDRGSDRRDADTMRYYMQGRRLSGQSAEISASIAALRSNRDVLERWQYELGPNSIDELRGEAQRTQIEVLALRTLTKSSVSETELKAALRDLDEFSAITDRCMIAVPRFSNINNRPLPPPIRTDAAQKANRLSQGESYKAAFAERKSLHAQLTRRAIDATSREFLEELKQTRHSRDVPLALVRFYGAGLLGTTARSDPAIAPSYDAHLSQLQAVERAAVQAEFARLRAIEAKNAAARAEDLKRRIAGNLPPTLAEVEALLIASSASKTRAALGEETEFEGSNKYSIYARLFGNRIKTGEYTLSFSNLVCRAENSRQHCTWNESSKWTSFHLLGAIQGPPKVMSSKSSGVFRWAESGLIGVGEIDVGWVGFTTVRRSGGDSSSGSNNSSQTLQDQFMEREVDNRQNYLDRTQSMGSNAPPYNPAKRY